MPALVRMRQLNVAPEAASLLPASHIAQLHGDASNDDNVCVMCGALIDGPVAELVVLHDDRTILARLAHPACAPSGAYAWEGTTDAVRALTLRPDGLDVATLLAWRRAPRPRALVLVEPRIQIALGDGGDDSLERLFATPLGLAPAARPISELQAPPAAGELRPADDGGLELATDALRVTIPARPDVVDQWYAHADDGRAVVIVGRGLGIGGPDTQLLATLDAALLTRPTWAATFAVSRGGAAGRRRP